MSFTNDKCFVDTNILLYQHSDTESNKREKAAELIEDLLLKNTLWLSTQVIQEFCFNSIKKFNQPVEWVRIVVGDYMHANIVVNDSNSALDALDIAKTYQLSYWDSLIINAAHYAKCKYLISEDLNHGQKIKGVKIINPFI